MARVELRSPPVEFACNGKTKTPTDRILIGARTHWAGRDPNLFNPHRLAVFTLNSSSEIRGSQRTLIVDQLRLVSGPDPAGGRFQRQPPRVAGRAAGPARICVRADDRADFVAQALLARPSFSRTWRCAASVRASRAREFRTTTRWWLISNLSDGRVQSFPRMARIESDNQARRRDQAGCSRGR